MKLLMALATIFLLSACNVEKALMQNIAVESHQRMSFERFARLSDVATTKEESTAYKFRGLIKYSEGDVLYVAPGLSYNMGTNAKLFARKSPNGQVVYGFLIKLEYADDAIRYYSSAEDISGNKISLKRRGAYNGNCAGDTCYKKEEILLIFPQETINEAALEDLLLTLKASGHEKTQARKNKNRVMGLGEQLALLNELEGRTNNEYKDNDNYDLVIPKEYIRNMIKLMQSQ